MSWEHRATQDDLLAPELLSNPIPIWANNDFQHDARLLSAQMFAQNMQESELYHPELVRIPPYDEVLAGNGGLFQGQGYQFENNYIMDVESDTHSDT